MLTGAVLTAVNPAHRAIVEGAAPRLTSLWRWFAPETVLESSRLLLVLVIAVVGLFAAAATTAPESDLPAGRAPYSRSALQLAQ
jgi:hypothetical protein